MDLRPGAEPGQVQGPAVAGHRAHERRPPPRTCPRAIGAPHADEALGCGVLARRRRGHLAAPPLRIPTPDCAGAVAPAWRRPLARSAFLTFCRADDQQSPGRARTADAPERARGAAPTLSQAELKIHVFLGCEMRHYIHEEAPMSRCVCACVVHVRAVCAHAVPVLASAVLAVVLCGVSLGAARDT